METLQSLSKLRMPVSRSTLLTVSALVLIFFIAFSIRLLPMRWGVELSEFDPYFHFQFTEKILDDGYLDWLSWTTADANRWYPIERAIAPMSFPGLALTAATLHNVLSTLGVVISPYQFCVIFPAVFGALACIVAFFLGNDVGGKAVGLLSALFLALNPSHITRTAAGFFDDETIGITSILLFSFFFLRALDGERSKKHSTIYAIAAGLTLGYVTASWGAALYPVAMATLFIFVLILIRRYSRNLLISYSITFGLGLFIAINVPKNGVDYLTTWAILPALGVLGFLCLREVLSIITTQKWKLIITIILLVSIISGFLVFSYTGYLGSVGTKFIRVLNPTQRGESEIFQSVQEHRLTAWGSIYYDYGVGVLFFAIGLFFAIRNLTNRNLFITLFGLTTLFFASSMVRLTILLAPAFSILMAIGVVGLLRPFIAIMKAPPKITYGKKYVTGRVGKEYSGLVLILVFVLLTFTYAFPSPRAYTHAFSSPTILSASVPVRMSQPVEEWTEMLNWMQFNLPENSIICSWWDYGYWITVKGNQTSLADNATFNTTHIGMIGKVFMSNETEAVRILRESFNGPNGPPTHILVFTTFNSLGGDQGYGDEGKWRWMARIANESVAEGFYHEWGDREQYNTFGNITTDASGNSQWAWNGLGQNTTIYKLMETGKTSRLTTEFVPELEKFRIAHLSPGQPLVQIGTYENTPVYLHALVCLYEIVYD